MIALQYYNPQTDVFRLDVCANILVAENTLRAQGYKQCVVDSEVLKHIWSKSLGLIVDEYVAVAPIFIGGTYGQWFHNFNPCDHHLEVVNAVMNDRWIQLQKIHGLD